MKFLRPDYITYDVNRQSNGNIELYNGLTKKTLLFTKEMISIVDYFSVPNSFPNLVEKISTESNLPFNDVKDATVPLLKVLLKKKILVEESDMSNGESSQEERFPVGSTIGELRIDCVLAESAKRKVLLCIRESDNKRVVVKLGLNPKRNHRSYFEREYNITSKAAEKNNYVVKPIRILEERGTEGIVTEYFDGIPVNKFLNKKHQSLTKWEIYQLIHEILIAFEGIHASGILHGDIHFGNILIGKNNQPKIIDLGLGEQILDTKTKKKLGGVCFFCPPERIGVNFDKKFISPGTECSEVYQIGVMLYFILFGEVPFTGYSWTELRTKILSEQPTFKPVEDYLNFRPDEEWNELLKQCLEKRPEDRTATVAQLIKKIEGIMKEE